MSGKLNETLSPTHGTHSRTNTLSLARSPSQRTTIFNPHPELEPAAIQSKSRRSSDEISDDEDDTNLDEARGLVEEMDVLDSHPRGFDRPDRGEMTLILGSTAMVVLVAVAAGLTTIYDWVL
jgi:hypothetical protein